MYEAFVALVVCGIILGCTCILGGVAWVIERLIYLYERRNRHA